MNQQTQIQHFSGFGPISVYIWKHTIASYMKLTEKRWPFISKLNSARKVSQSSARAQLKKTRQNLQLCYYSILVFFR